MIRIIGPQLYQWDTGRIVTVTDTDATHVHLANQGDSRAVKMELVDSQALIPDYLFQTGKQLRVYAVANGVTIERNLFSVINRERPEHYVYEDDQRNYIYELIQAAEDATAEAERVSAELLESKANGEFTGPVGPQGPQGAKGDPGVDGTVAFEDLTEEQVASLKGDPGEAGKDGVSPTHSWNGTVLTITSASGTSSADLKGEKGDKGDTGAQGIQGIQGAKGDTGADGTTPHIGDNGNWWIGGTDTGVQAEGQDGDTPVRGEDYWTEADKAEIKAYVDEAILGGAW